MWLLMQLQGTSSRLSFPLSFAVSAAVNAHHIRDQQNLFHASFSLCCRHIRKETAGQRLEDGVMAKTQFKLCLMLRFRTLRRHRESPGSNEPLDALRMSEFLFPLSWQLELLTLRIFLNFTKVVASLSCLLLCARLGNAVMLSWPWFSILKRPHGRHAQ